MVGEDLQALEALKVPYPDRVIQRTGEKLVGGATNDQRYNGALVAIKISENIYLISLGITFDGINSSILQQRLAER